MKFFYLALLFCFSPIVQVYATTPKSVTCTRTEYREEYIPGTKSNPGYVKSYEVDVVIPCGQTFLTIGLKNLSASEASTINYLQVLFGSIWGVLFFSEIININFLLGASLVLLGTIISTTKITKRT